MKKTIHHAPPYEEDLTQVAQIMNSHFEFLKENKSYINEILEGKKSEEEAKRYLYDVYGLRCLPGNAHELVILLKSAIDDKLQIYQPLEELTNRLENSSQLSLDEIQKIACILKLSLNFIPLFKKVANSQHITNTILIKLFVDVDFYESIVKILNKYIPKEDFANLEKIIKLGKIKVSEENKPETQAQTGSTTFSAITIKALLNFNWEIYIHKRQNEILQVVKKSIGDKKMQEFFQEVKDNFSQLEEKQQKIITDLKENYKQELEAIQESGDLTKKPSAAAAFQLEFLKVSKDCQEADKLLNKVETNGADLRDLYHLVKDNVYEYFKVRDAYDKAVKLEQKMDEIEQLRNAFIKKHKLRKSQLVDLQTSINKLITIAKSENMKIESEQSLSDLNEIKILFEASVRDWLEIYDTDIYTCDLTINDITNCYKSFSKVIDSIQNQIDRIKNDIKQSLITCHTRKECDQPQLPAQRAQEIKNNRELQEQYQQNRLTQLEENRKKIADYRRNVAAVREEKKRKQSDINNTINSVSIFNSNNNSTTSIVKFINTDIENIILNLNSRQFGILSDIVNERTGIKYNEVISIIRACGGEISEIGNGSSHKRIRLNKLITEIRVHDEADIDDTKSQKTRDKSGKNIQSANKIAHATELVNPQTDYFATSGFFRAHGKQHTERKLCEFNLHLVNKLFTKAGITSEMLLTLEEKRMNRQKHENCM